jgi:uncharacterized protein with PIN domain
MNCVLAGAEAHRGRPLNSVVRLHLNTTVARNECPKCHQPMPESPPVSLSETFEPLLWRVAMVVAAIIAVALGFTDQLMLALMFITGALVMWWFSRSGRTQPRCPQCNQLLTNRENAI